MLKSKTAFLLLCISLLSFPVVAQDLNDPQYEQQQRYQQEQQAARQKADEQEEMEDQQMRRSGYYPRAQLEGMGGYSTGCRSGGGC